MSSDRVLTSPGIVIDPPIESDHSQNSNDASHGDLVTSYISRLRIIYALSASNKRQLVDVNSAVEVKRTRKWSKNRDFYCEAKTRQRALSLRRLSLDGILNFVFCILPEIVALPKGT